MNTELNSLPSIGDGFCEPQLNIGDINESLWRDIKRDLLAFEQNQCTTPQQVAQLVHRMVVLHTDLRDQPAFNHTLQCTDMVSRGNNAWTKRLLLQDDDMHLQLISYFADHPTPIHDYPSLAIVNLPIFGSMEIDYYNPGQDTLESAYPIAKLRRTETHLYGVYEATLSFPWLHNIQEIRAVTERCVALSAGLNATGAQEKYWYLPISPQTTETFFAQRLKRHE